MRICLEAGQDFLAHNGLATGLDEAQEGRDAVLARRQRGDADGGMLRADGDEFVSAERHGKTADYW